MVVKDGSTPIILAAKKGHKGVVIILMENGAKVDLSNQVSVCVHMLYYKPCINEDKCSKHTFT